MLMSDSFKIMLIISYCLTAGYLFGRWWEHRLYLEFMFDRIINLTGN